MPVAIKSSRMEYKDDNGNYIGVDAVSERTTAEQVAEIEAVGDATISRVNSAISQSETAIEQMESAADGIESQRDTMIAAIASVAGQGTDTTFTQSGVAADAKAVGDLKNDLSDLDETVDEIQKRSFKEIRYTKEIATVSGQSILASKVQIARTIDANTPFTVELVDDDDTLSGYTVYCKQATLRGNCVPNTAYELKKDFIVSDISIYTNTVTKTGVVTLVVTVYQQKTSILESRVDILFDKTDNVKTIPQSVNLLDYTKITSGYINPNNGEIGNGYYHTDYIPVKKDVTYYAAIINSTRCALYDINKKYTHAVVPTDDNDFSGTWYFTPDADGFFRGTLFTITNNNAFGYLSPVFNAFRSYNGIVDYSYASEKHNDEISKKALGGETSNLFEGLSNYGSFNGNTHIISYEASRIVTPYIRILKHLYWIFNEKLTGCVQYLYEYDENKAFIKATTLSGSWFGWKTLDTDTEYIRLSTGSLSGMSRQITPYEFDKLLYVTDHISKINKFIPPITDVMHRDGTAWDFYTRTVTFYNDYVESAIKNYTSEIERTGYDFVMPINTDLHTLNSEPFNMLTYMSESGVADVCFNLGDNIGEEYESGEEAAFNNLAAIHLWSNSPFKKCPLIVLRGNHDNHPITGSVTDKNMLVSNAQYYNAMQLRTQKGFAGTNKNYGFLDFEQAKVRVIFLDSGDIYANDGEPLTSGFNVTIRQEQLNWFCNHALNFMSKSDRAEWSVITCSHAQLKQLAESAFNEILKAFIDGTSVSGTQIKDYADTGKQEILTYNVDFTLQGAMEYICHVNGHNHYDYAFKMGTTNRYDIDICADAQSERGSYDGTTVTPYTWTPGTIEERCMDTLCIDKANRKIIMKRLGVGASQMVHGQREFNY